MIGYFVNATGNDEHSSHFSSVKLTPNDMQLHRTSTKRGSLPAAIPPTCCLLDVASPLLSQKIPSNVQSEAGLAVGHRLGGENVSQCVSFRKGQYVQGD